MPPSRRPLTSWHGQQQRIQPTETETGDEDGNEGRHRSIGNHDQERFCKDDPEFEVDQQLESLSLLEVGVANAGIIDTHSCNSNVPFTLIETFCSDWVGRHEEENDDGPEDGDSACNKIHVLPRSKTAASDVSKTVVDEGRDSRDVAGAAIPRTHAKGLFILLVPSTCKISAVQTIADHSPTTIMNMGEIPDSRNPRKKRWANRDCQL